MLKLKKNFFIILHLPLNFFYSVSHLESAMDEEAREIGELNENENSNRIEIIELEIARVDSVNV